MCDNALQFLAPDLVRHIVRRGVQLAKTERGAHFRARMGRLSSVKIEPGRVVSGFLVEHISKHGGRVLRYNVLTDSGVMFVFDRASCAPVTVLYAKAHHVTRYYDSVGLSAPDDLLAVCRENSARRRAAWQSETRSRSIKPGARWASVSSVARVVSVSSR